MANEVEIVFIRDSKAGECDGQIFEGKKMKVSRESADRWIRRGAAEEVPDKKAAAAAAKAKAEADKKAAAAK